jgi:ChrR Cupin-like domain
MKFDHGDADASLAPKTAREIKRRLLDHVADAESSHVSIDAEQGLWQPFLADVQIKVVREFAGTLSYLLRLAPGASVPPHRHPLDEECVVVEGVLRIGSRSELGPGGYHLARQGTLHATLSTETGALVFLRGAEPRPSDLLA